MALMAWAIAVLYFMKNTIKKTNLNIEFQNMFMKSSMLESTHGVT